jgi:hypothetical protein
MMCAGEEECKAKVEKRLSKELAANWQDEGRLSTL